MSQKLSEKEIQNRIMIALSTKNSRVFRNNVGSAITVDGRYITFGLAKGSADLIGWRTIEITPDMVGKKIAQFLSVEVKNKTGKLTKLQQNWHDAVNSQGGLAIISKSESEALDAIKRT